jgi:aryl-alcohol dehydrogenase-like predicted oxidoreductase
MHDGPNGAGLSRKAILSEIDKSLKRLRTDYVDLYQIHRWDYQTPIEETVEALNDMVRAGNCLLKLLWDEEEIPTARVAHGSQAWTFSRLRT